MGPRGMQRHLLLCSVPVSAFLVALPAQAQESQETVAPTPQAGTAADSGEIVVTAQRRSERLVDVPITIAVANADQLQSKGVSDTRDLQRVTPGLQLPLYGAFISPSVRGVSGAIINAGGTPATALYIDGVYQPSQVGQLLELADVKEIEVLKGPQGTLYGQNAEAGAMIITTLAPSFKPAGDLALSYGNFNDFQAKGYLTGPIAGDTVAASIAFGYHDRDGFRRDIISNERDHGFRSYLVRGKLLFQLSDSAKITATGYYTTVRDSGIFTTTVYNGLSEAALVNPALVANPDPLYRTTVAPSQDFHIKAYGGSLRGDFTTDVGQFGVVGSYSYTQSHGIDDLDGTRANIADVLPVQTMNNVIAEANFVSNKFGGFQFTSGLFFQDTRDNIDPTLVNVYAAPPFIPPTIYPNAPGPALFAGFQRGHTQRQTFAAYAELSYDLTPNLVVTGGVRFTHDVEHFFANNGTFANTALTEIELSPQTVNHASPRATIRYKLNDRSNLYFTYGEGFKSGLLNGTSVSGSATAVKPETLTAFEAGYKGTILPGLTINLSGFWYDYKNKQVARYDPPLYINQNAASARIKGIDFDGTYAVTSNFSLSVGVEFLDAKYRDFKQAGVYVVNPATGQLASVNMDVSGGQIEYAPKFTANVTANYHVDMAAGRLSLNASLYHSSSQRFDAAGLINQGSYDLVDAELAFQPHPLPNLRLSVYGHNLANEAYISSALITNFAATAAYAPPRQYGMRAEYKF